MNRFFILVLMIGVQFFSSCRVKKSAHVVRKSEKTELKDLHIKKELKKEIAVWLGTPYRYGGVSKKGVDCSGLVNAIFLEVYEKKIPRSSKEIYAACKHIKTKDLQEGDLVFFNFTGKGISHVGLYLSEGKYVHASSTNGVVISDLDNEYTKKRYVGAGRVK